MKTKLNQLSQQNTELLEQALFSKSPAEKLFDCLELHDACEFAEDEQGKNLSRTKDLLENLSQFFRTLAEDQSNA